MNSYALVSLVCSIAFLAIGIFTFARNPRTPLSRIYLALTASFAYWAFIEFGLRSAGSLQAAVFWSQAGFLKSLTVSFVLHFILTYTGRIDARHRWFVHPLLYLPALVFAGLDITTGAISGAPQPHDWGWSSGLPAEPGVLWAYLGWIGVVAVIVLFASVRFYLNSRTTHRREAVALMTVMGVLVVVGSVAVLFDRLVASVPEVTTVVVGVVFMLYTHLIYRFDLFRVTPAAAAEDIIAAMPETLIIADMDDTILRANTAATTLSGYGRRELEGAPLTVLFDRAAAGEETELKRKSGERVPVLIQSTVMRDRGGNPFARVILGHDLTRRKLEEQELRKVHRLETLEMISRGMAHDFANVLTAITGEIAVARLSEGLPAEAAECLATAEQAGHLAGQIVGQLSAFVRNAPPVTVMCRVDAVAREAAVLAVLGSPVKTDVDAEEGLWSVAGDPAQLTQALLNLVLNARHAMPRGGTVTVRCRNQAEAAGRAVRVEVVDEGVGIPPEVLGRIFEPFFTTRETGTGLGLTIVRTIVEKHHGRIAVDSAVGRGTTFTLWLPAAPDASAT
jgi:signal transduction histidine kinase